MKASLLREGLIVDGGDQPGWHGDVLFADGRILAVAPNIDAAQWPALEVEEIDCRGKVIAPGFIDAHTHDDAASLDVPGMLPKLSQGVTTVVVGNCGISLVPVMTQDPIGPLALLNKEHFRYPTFKSYVDAVNETRPCVNVAALLGHTALRIRHMDDLNRPATLPERKAMSEAVVEAMENGALGLSYGVFYKEAFAADMDELVDLAKVVGETGGVYTVHIRDELEPILTTMMEAAETAKRAGAPVIYSHHKCCGPANWGRTQETLALIDKLSTEQDVGLDVYPYVAGSTVIRPDLADGTIDILITGSEPYPEMGGRYLKDIAEEWGITQAEAAERLKPGGACYFQMHEDDVSRVIAHPNSMIGSDGLPHDKRPHPRLWGAFPRVLALYWREKGLLRLEQAVHKMTGLTAKRLKLSERGLLRAGYYADVVVFDPKTVRDAASFEEPMQFAEGIEKVWVNGTLSYTAEQRATGAHAGCFIPRSVG